MIVNKKTFTVSSQYHIDHRSAEIVKMFHFSQEVKLLHYIDVNCNEYEFKTFYLQWLNMNISFVKYKFDDMGDLPDDSMNGVNNFKTGPMDCGKKVSKCVDFVVLYRYNGYKIGQILYLLCIKFDFILNLKDLLEKKYIWLGQSGLVAEHLSKYWNFFYKKFDVVFETAFISKLTLFRIIKIRSHSKPIVYLWNVIWGKTKCTSRSDRSLKWYYHNVASNKNFNSP